MRKPRSDGENTRQRLLAAAGKLFAERGYRATRVAEICRRAGANLAAINYHFGGKDRLYVEAWREAFARSLERHPPDGGVPADAPAEQRLRGRVLAVMRRVLDPDSHDLDITHKEMASPTGLLLKAVRSELEPLRTSLSEIIAELLGPGAGEEQLRLCRMSVISQCLGPLLHERRRLRLPRSKRPPPPEALPGSVESMADHVVRFSLAGIREVARKPAGAGKTGGGPGVAARQDMA